MYSSRRILSAVITLSLVGCGTSTMCDCVPLQVVIFGTVTGTTAATSVEVRVGPGQCQDGVVPTSGFGTVRPQANGSYEVSIARPQLGTACIVATAKTLDPPILTTGRSVTATITDNSSGDPQRIRADLAFGSP